MQRKKLNNTSNETEAHIKAICNRYAHDKGEIINVLNDVQDVFGYLPKHVQLLVATEMDVNEAKIGGLVGFYSFFRNYPKGKHVIKVCNGRSCSLRRSAEVLETFKKELNLEPGQTTEDEKITLMNSGCMGACGLGPVTMVNDNTYPRNNPENARKIVMSLLNDSNQE